MKHSKEQRSEELTPKNIQPYYKAWMKANPQEPRSWEKEWRNNLHFTNWIREQHREFKTTVLNINCNDLFEMAAPYSIEEQKKFNAWLFDKVGIEFNTVVL